MPLHYYAGQTAALKCRRTSAARAARPLSLALSMHWAYHPSFLAQLTQLEAVSRETEGPSRTCLQPSISHHTTPPTIALDAFHSLIPSLLLLLFLFHSLHFRFPFRALRLASIDRILHPPPHPLALFRRPNPPTDDAHLTPSIFDFVGPRILLTLRFGQFTRLPRASTRHDCPLRPFRDRESIQPHHLDHTTVLNLCDPAIS